MNPNLKSRISLVVFIIIISFSSAIAQVIPMTGQCNVLSISATDFYPGPGSGTVGTVSVTSQNNCTGFTVSKNGSWLSYSQGTHSVTISVTANSGAARTGYVYIGGSFTVTIHQSCGNYPGAAGSISGSTSVCKGQSGVSYYVSPITNATGYTWTLPVRASIASGDGTNSITVNYPSNALSGDITVAGYNACSTGSTSPPLTVTVNSIAQPGTISGTTPACAGSTYTYSVTPVTGAVSYTWTIPTGASGSSTTNSINVTFGTQSGTISVVANSSAGCVSTPSSLAVTVNYLNQYSVIGTATTCPGIGIPVSLQGSTNGIVYKCYLNGVWQSGDMITGNGGNNVSWNKYAPGTYTITGVNGSCEVLMSGSAVISNYTQSTAPTGINASVNPICKNGTGTTLTSAGGGLGTNANWKWYTGGCGPENGGTLIYTGNSCFVNPQTTTTYWVRAEGMCNNTLCASITVTVIAPPTVTQQPQSVTICDGAPTSFSISASGGVSYQWQYSVDGINWNTISGATSTSYSISNTSGMNGRGFKCIVTGTSPCNFTTPSSAAYITFSYLYPYTVHSQWTTICPGDANEITLDGSSSNTSIMYTCYLNGSALNPPVHGTGSPLSFGNHNQAGTYTVKAVNQPDGCVIQMSGTPTLTVRTPSTAPTSITASPTDICPGGNPGGGSTLTLVGGSLESGFGVWHWYSGGTPCGTTPEGTGTTNISVSPSVTTTYSVRAEGGCVITSCAYVTVNVKPLPTITAQPFDYGVSIGSDATFSVTATGPNLQYQWQVSPDGVNSWTDLTGLPAQNYQTANLTIKGSTSFEDNSYRCKITSDCSTIYSRVVKIALQFPGSGYLTGQDIPDPETRQLSTSNLVGASNGSFNVNTMGGSSYTIPIETPLGVNGLAPSLAMSYSSNSGSGIPGFGWQIAGLSSINRGPQTFYNDGRSKGVALDTTDRFYLDGQRLVNTIYSYGASNAQYQTDNDIFTRVTPQATDTYGPGWFKAETKSGLLYEYGNTNASKQKISGYSNVLNWYVSKVSDLFGNSINYTYIQDHGSVYPSEITYGPNTITFNYKQRNDKSPSFFKGIKTEQWLLLDNIVIKYNSSVIKKYEFKQSFQSSNYNSYSILNEVIEYGLGSSRLNSTAFSYQTPDGVSLSQTNYNTTHDFITYKSFLITGDFNGDGKIDFFCLPDTTKGATWTGFRTYFGDGNDNFPTSFTGSTPIHLNKLRDIRAMDLNGDGIDDILYEYASPSGSSYFYYMLSNGSSFSQPVLLISRAYSSHTGFTGKARRTIDKQEDDNERTSNGRGRPSTLWSSQHKNPIDADYNGDGINDIFINNSSGDWSILSLANSSGQLTPNWNTLGSGNISTLTGDVLSGDFNGDGKADIWSFEDSGVKIYTFNGTTLELLYSSSWPTNKHFFFLGDFNGDGKVDIFLYGYGKSTGTQYDWSTWQVQLSTGTGFEEHDIAQKKTNLKNDNVRIGDFNGDGATDIMVNSLDMSWNGTYFYISKNDGTDLYPESLPSYPIASHNYYLADYNGDGQTDLICTDGVSPWWTGYQVYRTTGKTKALMNKVANGLGFLTKLSYIKLSEASSLIYQRGTGSTFPVMEFHAPLDIVDSVQMDNGTGSMNTQTYYYEGAKLHLQGNGFLGFAKTIVTDVTSGIENGNTYGYNTSYYYPTSLKSFSKLVGTNDTIQRGSNTWAQIVLDGNKKRIFPYIQGSTQVNKLTGLSVTTSAQFDNFGNPTTITKSYSNGPTESTSNTYDNTVSTSQWLLGRPTATTNQFTSDTTITRSGTRVFATASNQLTSETWYSGTNNETTKSYVYNTNGTLQSQTTTAGSVSRSNSCTYESDNIRIHSTTDQLSHVTTNSYDNYGWLYTQQDFLGNVSTYQYDDLGRTYTALSPDGSLSTTTYSWHDPTSDPLLVRYSVEVTSNDGSQKLSWYDELGRVIRADVQGFDGTMINTSTVYNTKGQIESVSEPYYSGGSPQLNTFEYDDYGRKTGITRPSGRNTSWEYNNNIVTETTGGKSYYKTYSSDGTISSATDNGGTITYTYYPDGKSRTITAPGGNVTNMFYDLAGNQKKLVDPSAGTIKYSYNGFGELTSQVSPGPKSITISYLADGRISQKVTNEGTTKYRYNTNKQLRNARAPGNISKTFRYDSKGRVVSVTDTIPGIDTLRTSRSYDNIGRCSTITHPSGIVESYTYSNGYLSSVSTGGTARWTINSMNARRQVTTGQFANNLNTTFGFDNYGFPTSTVTGTIQDNSYNFNPVSGNLNWRQNNKYSGLREDFQYDNLDRLTSVQKNDTTTLSYDSSTGSILTKSDAGTFNYDNKPYSISSIDPSIGFTPADTTDAQSINYTSTESVSSITEKTYEADFLYNSDNERVQMLVKQNGSAILTRWYSGGGYIKEIDGSTIREYTFIGGDAYSATVVAITQSGSTTYYDLLRDHLGSITHVVNSSTNAVVAEYSYDAWGRMRDPATWVNYTSGSEPGLFAAGRGYTGHEHMPWFNLINMNGRLYDPIIAMFLSPDPVVQEPVNSQSYNRYAYCLNNPLVYTDPSGEFFLGTLFTFVGDFLRTTLFHGGLSFDKDVRNRAWKDFDPSAKWSATNKAWKIDIGGFKTDPHRTIVGRGLQLLSRWTWELPQTLIGKGASHIRNMTGNVDDVSYYGGATLVNKDDNSGYKWGFTLGPYINSKNMVADPYTDQMFRHEYGHTLQSRLVGPLYLTSVALPSLVGQGLDDLGLNNHNYEWYETQANRMSYRYLNNHDPGTIDALPWPSDDPEYPREYHPTWYWFVAHPPLPFAWWLFF